MNNTYMNNTYMNNPTQSYCDETWKQEKRPRKIKGEGTPGKFYFRITSPKYQLVEINKKNAYHHYLLCFESIA